MRDMLRLILVGIALAVLLPIIGQAATINLQWDASVSQVDGYAVYDKNYQKPYNYAAPIWTGSGLTCSVTVPDDRMSAFVARAYKYGPYDLQGNRTTEWSGNSNEVQWAPTVTPPEPPRNFAIRILTALLRLFGIRRG